MMSVRIDVANSPLRFYRLIIPSENHTSSANPLNCQIFLNAERHTGRVICINMTQSIHFTPELQLHRCRRNINFMLLLANWQGKDRWGGNLWLKQSIWCFRVTFNGSLFICFYFSNASLSKLPYRRAVMSTHV